MSGLCIEKGNIDAYRIFDVGNDINLDKVKLLLEEKLQGHTYSFHKSYRSLLISEHPKAVQLNGWQEKIRDELFDVSCRAKIWSFGAVSIQMTVNLQRPYSMTELCQVSHYLENNETFHKEAEARVKNLQHLILPAIESPHLWDQYEDYLIFRFFKVSGLDSDLVSSFRGHHMTSLILGEQPMEFSEQANQDVAAEVYQYGVNDLALIHWNGAVIYDVADPEDTEDIASTIEYALCQLLELRYYDHLLESQLQELYQRVEASRAGIFHNPYEKISRQAALEYIDISEIVDRVGNAFKVIGDFYYASLYKAVLEKLHIHDWRRSIDHKLHNLAEVSKLFQGTINDHRGQLMELTIILLIAIEVLPVILALFRSH